MFKISKKVRRLSNEEKDQYKKDGYLTGLPVFSSEANDDLSNFFVSLSEKVDKKIDINQTAQWHKASHKFYKLCTTPEILDYVEDLLGPNFFLWGGQFFLKEPKDGSVVPWHQDAQYWPLFPASYDQIKQDDIISLNLKAGEISLHNDALLHGSEPNISSKRRCGLTMRFSPVNVKADLSIWPHFEGQLVRGVDDYKLNSCLGSTNK